MHTLDMLKELINHMNWADAKIWTTVLLNSKAENDEKLIKILHHYQITKYAFYHIWKNKSPEFPELSKFKTLKDMAEWAAGYPKLILTYLSGLNEQDLGRMIHIPWADRLEKILGKKPMDSNLAETIMQVAAHSSHHRGQVSSRIRELKGEPPLVDFIAWVWLGKPEDVWSL
ncbi:MAG: DinB family protein [Calditrichaceae bacterium]|jgi:uncharacterized damage-inducible protein DinB